MLLNKPGVYKILNWANGKIYIGGAVRVKHRVNNHKSDLRNVKHSNSHLQNAYNKYGEKYFTYSCVEYCELENVMAREQYWIDETNCCDKSIGYNILKIAGSSLGYVPSEAQRKKHSEFMTGLARSQAVKDKISMSMKGIQQRLGHKDSDAAKLNKSIAQSKRTQEMRDNQSASQRNVNKWPHIDGCRCKCNECRITRNKLNVERKNRK